VVALKSSHHFRAGFQDLATAIITADPPGLRRGVCAHAQARAALADRPRRDLPRLAYEAARARCARRQ